MTAHHLNIRASRLRVHLWHRLHQWAGRRQDRAYDHLVDIETRQ